jgi:thiopeptide-type bacteriocin biosynthesis protein
MSEPTPLNDFAASGFFVLRTPLLPFDELLAWSAGLEAPSAGDNPGQLELALAADRARLRQRLRTVFARPEVREALFVASADLEERFDLWRQQPESEAGQKIERALVRYFARMAGRATPFGLFAGCSVGTVGADTRLVLAEQARYRRHTRLDMDYLVLLTDALARDPNLRSVLKFWVNTSLYPVQGRLRYSEVRRNGKGWTHHQVALAATSYLEATLARARDGASPPVLAAAPRLHEPEASQAEAEEYIGDLIDNQVLVSELRPSVTGPEPIHRLADQLRRRGAAAAADRLDMVRQELEAIDENGLGTHPARYRHLARLLDDLPGPVEPGRLFQVDLIKPMASASLGSAVLDEIRRGIALLHRLARPRREDPLVRFREAFVERYEGREVPLVEALDEGTGIGFDTLFGGAAADSALLDGLTFPKVATQTISWGRCEALLLRKLSEYLAACTGEIDVTAHDVEEMAEPTPAALPDAFAALAAVAAGSEEALASGDFRVLLTGVSGPPGARLLGRFCHGDPELHQWVMQHVQAEAALQADAVFAEIVHLPEGRLGNILARPVLRAYEIPYLGAASVCAERQIPVTDLRVSVRGEQIILRSARLGRRVIPRLTSAHNFAMSQGIYRFLCVLQAQGTAGELSWDWGPLRDAPVLPRVVSGRLVLSRGSWRVGPDELKALAHARAGQRFRAVQAWRTARRLPRWIALADGDNELPIDLDNVLAVDTLVELLKGRDRATLVELFPGPDQLWAHGPEGRFVQELVVPFIRRGVRGQRSEVQGERSNPDLRPLTSDLCLRTPASLPPRRFPPGSEWLYVKLYTGPATADQVLHEVVKPVVERAMESGAADRWFFIRYGDPDWHLRLRFHGQPARLYREVLPALQAAAAPLLDDGRLWRIQLDTYEREVERYGGAEGVALAERLFHSDCEAILALALFLAENARGDVRWRLALCGMHLLLLDLGFDLETRRAVVRRIRDSFAAEFHVDAAVEHQLGVKFRKERRSVESLLDVSSSPSPLPGGAGVGTVKGAGADARLAWGVETLRRRSEMQAPTMAELTACAQAGRLSVALEELAASYLHMHANRLLRSGQRAQELVLYDLLFRFYESQSARMRDNLATAIPAAAESDSGCCRPKPR